MQALPRRLQFKTVGFPHSDISGSKATNRLPEAFRRLVASFIAVLGQGIHRVLLCLSYGDLHSTTINSHFFYFYSPFIARFKSGRRRAYSYVKDSRVSSKNETVPPTAAGGQLQNALAPTPP